MLLAAIGTGRDVAKGTKNKLVVVNTRLFADDVQQLRRIAAERGIPYQTELRLLVRRALRGERREVLMLKDGET